MNAQQHMKWFHDARFGIFVHWGLYSLLGQGTWVMNHARIPHSEYARLANRFKPAKFDAKAWASLAAECGAKYMVFTTRHHEGFCMFDSQVSDFTSVKTAAKRDFVAEYVEACRAAGLRVGFYYSLLDWRFPGYFEREKYQENAEAMVQQAHDQVRELLKNYGQIDLVWFDGHWFQDHFEWCREKPEVLSQFWRSQELLDMMRRLQPHIIINDRTGLPGDYDTPEQHVTASRQGRAWETCQTIGDFWESWCYQRFTPRPSRKTVHQLIIQLATAAGREGNFLLNVGPKPDGTFPREDVKRLKGIGEWMRANGEAIYGSQRVPFSPEIYLACGLMSLKGNVGYLLLPCWPGRELIVSRVGVPVKSATFLATGEQIETRLGSDGRLFLLNLPKTPPDPYVTVIKLEFDGPFSAFHDVDRGAWVNGHV